MTEGVLQLVPMDVGEWRQVDWFEGSEVGGKGVLKGSFRIRLELGIGKELGMWLRTYTERQRRRSVPWSPFIFVHPSTHSSKKRETGHHSANFSPSTFLNSCQIALRCVTQPQKRTIDQINRHRTHLWGFFPRPPPPIMSNPSIPVQMIISRSVRSRPRLHRIASRRMGVCLAQWPSKPIQSMDRGWEDVRRWLTKQDSMYGFNASWCLRPRCCLLCNLLRHFDSSFSSQWSLLRSSLHLRQCMAETHHDVCVHAALCCVTSWRIFVAHFHPHEACSAHHDISFFVRQRYHDACLLVCFYFLGRSLHLNSCFSSSKSLLWSSPRLFSSSEFGNAEIRIYGYAKRWEVVGSVSKRIRLADHKCTLLWRSVPDRIRKDTLHNVQRHMQKNAMTPFFAPQKPYYRAMPCESQYSAYKSVRKSIFYTQVQDPCRSQVE